MLMELGAMHDLPIVSKSAAGIAKLRVAPAPMYDAELTGTSALSSLNFFRSPEGGMFQYATTTKKTYADTNMKQQGILGSPQVFDLNAFNIKVTPITVTPTTEADLYRVYVTSFFEFLFNNRPFLQIPTWEIPHGVGIEGVSTANNINSLHNGIGVRSNKFGFTVSAGKGGTARVRIRSTENFSANINFPSASATFVVSTKVHVMLQGTLYNGL